MSEKLRVLLNNVYLCIQLKNIYKANPKYLFTEY